VNRPKYVVFQLAALATAAVLLIIMIPIFLRVMRPTRESELSLTLVKYSGSYDVTPFLTDKENFSLQEKLKVSTWLDCGLLPTYRARSSYSWGPSPSPSRA
jgi:hypothetical protein